MLDKSGSMMLDGTRWPPVAQALKSFVTNPNSDGLGVGLGYFPLAQGTTTVCDMNVYATPDVPIGVLPGQASTLTASIDAHDFALAQAHDPDHYGTPTRPALEGATNYVRIGKP